MENRDDILKELKEIAPALSKVEKKPFDEAPLNYFSSFPEAMMKKVREQELAEVAPTLAQQQKGNAFKVPANYFRSFPEMMLKEISSEQNPKTTATSKWQESLNSMFDGVANIILKPRYAFAIAGTVSIVIIGVLMLVKVEECNDLDCKMASLTDAEINAYLDSDTDVYSDEIFESTYDENTSGAEIYKDALTTLSDEELDNAILD